MTLSKEYIAGFFDGEGCIDIRFRTTHNGKYQRFELRLTISQVYRKPLDLISDIYGGSVSPRKNGNIHYYVVSGKQANAMLLDIYDFLVVKKDEAKVALDFYLLMNRNKAKELPNVTKQKAELFYLIRQIRQDKGISSKSRRQYDIKTA